MNFRERSQESEWMDRPDLPIAELEQTLVEIEQVNHRLGGYGPSIDGLEHLVAGRSFSRPLRVLDVGTGGADTPRAMLAWADKRGLELEVIAIDLSEATIEFARRQTAGLRGIELRRQDLFEIPSGERFDVVHAALMLHHLSGEVAERALRTMYERAELGIVVNDLHRHPVAWAGIHVLARIMSQSAMFRNDAPLSVLRAFSRAELRQLCLGAGIPAPLISWRPMFRWQMLVERSS